MQVFNNYQIGYSPQTYARPYDERAVTRNRLTNAPFTVSENPDMVDNNNRQNLPVDAYKVDETEQGKLSGGNRNMKVIGSEYHKAELLQNMHPCNNSEPLCTTDVIPNGASGQASATVTSQGGGEKLNVPSDYFSPGSGVYSLTSGDLESEIAHYFAAIKPGQSVQWGGGTLTMVDDGSGFIYESAGGGRCIEIAKNTPISDWERIKEQGEALAAAAAALGKPFASNFNASTLEYAQSLGLVAEWKDSVTSPPITPETEIAHYFATTKPGQSVQWGSGTLTMVDDGSGFMYESAGGGRCVEIAKNTPISDWERIKKQGEALAAAATALGKPFASNFDASTLEYAQSLGLLGGWKEPSLAQAPSAQHYLNTATAVQSTVANHDIIC